MIFVIIVTIFVLSKYSSTSMDESLYNTIWYDYDIKTGYYNKFIIREKELDFYKSDNTHIQTLYDTCTRYSFDKRKGVYILDCNEKIRIDDIKEDSINIEINGKNYRYYSNPYDSLNYEFEKYYNQSISEYKIQRMQGIDFIKINYDRMMELLDINENQTFLIYGDNCSSVECALLLDVVEKWISTNENIYYVNISEFDNKQMIKLTKKNDKFLLDSSYYNDVYPRIVVTKKNKILDDYLFKCKGFNCSKYIRN